MSARPNVMFLMTDQMQAEVLSDGHPCLTPNIDRLIKSGVRFSRAYTPNAVCSPARASLMTGLLPHNHGVLEVVHCVDHDQCVLRDEKPHWASRLAEAGYKTGYFGKWHVERGLDLSRYGWGEFYASDVPETRRKSVALSGGAKPAEYLLKKNVVNPEGYAEQVFYGVQDRPVAENGMRYFIERGMDFVTSALADGAAPWCCFVSVAEPHDPFVCGKAAYDKYDVDALELPPNGSDELADRPGLYRKLQAVHRDMTDREKREARACYYASITEIDEQFGRIVNLIDKAGQLDNTIFVVTTDHGELLGAHGLFCKNVSAFEEVYRIPLVISGPGIPRGVVSPARVGSHDLCPTILDLLGLPPIENIDARSFAPVLRDPARAAEFDTGFAEYHGTRLRLTQRVYWEGDFKLVLNGFDVDEFYDLKNDPGEMKNLIDTPDMQPRIRALAAKAWRIVEQSGDHALFRSHYPAIRAFKYGPNTLHRSKSEKNIC